MDDIEKSVNTAVEIAQENKKEIELIRSTLVNHNTKLDEPSASCSTNSSRIDVIGKVVDKLQEEHQNVANSFNMEEFYMELNDRQPRINNLVIYNIKDTGNDEEDKEFIDSFFSKAVGFDISKIKYRRIGLFNKKAKFPRLIILMFESKNDAHSFLKLRQTVYTNNKLMTDKTQSQREYINKVVNEVKDYNKDNPPVPKTIKYRFNVPIITNDSKNSMGDQQAMEY